MKVFFAKTNKLSRRFGLGAQTWLLVLVPVMALMAVTQYSSHANEQIYEDSHKDLEQTFNQVQQAQLLSRSVRQTMSNMVNQILGHHQRAQLLLIEPYDEDSVYDFLDELALAVHLINEMERRTLGFTQRLQGMHVVINDDRALNLLQVTQSTKIRSQISSLLEKHFSSNTTFNDTLRETLLRSLGTPITDSLPKLYRWLDTHILMYNAGQLLKHGQAYQTAVEHAMSFFWKEIKNVLLRIFSALA